ncbi:MAG: glycosyl transferase [Planctomycetaceae bacterium TMED10]|nr:MAG: glycosyl transferase [Planctomycetaceae bacterium TMED10]
MADFHQQGPITTLHDLGSIGQDHLEAMLREATVDYRLGLILPVTASDMRAAPFENIVRELCGADYIEHVIVVLGIAPEVADYQETKEKLAPLGAKAEVLWTDGERLQNLYEELIASGFNLAVPGKGRSVWTAFGYLMADPSLKAYMLHDCDIVTYSRELLARLCLPMAHRSLDFEFCKAFYARRTNQLHGRTVRLLVWPLLRSLMTILGPDPFLTYLSSFRYPLSGEFAVSAGLARSNRIPSDWGLEVGTLAEVFRNTSTKRVCQVDITSEYEHKHQDLSLEDPSKGLMRMATDILTSMFRTLASRGTVLSEGHFVSLRSAFLRAAQDAIRQYHADALINGLQFDRHAEEIAVEGFAEQIMAAGTAFREDPAGGESIPNWTRVLAAFPDFPERLREAVSADALQWNVASAEEKI